MPVRYDDLPKPTPGTSRATSATETEILIDVSDTIADVGDRLDTLEAGGGDPFGWGFPYTVPPHHRSAASNIVSANRVYYLRSVGGGAVTKIGLEVNISSGNICVGVYANTGAGRSSAPGARKGTSGSVACPASGYVEVALTAPVVVDPGDWFAIQCDNTSASFWCAFTGVAGSGLPAGVQAKQDVALPLPATATSVTEAGPTFILVGVA